MDWRILQEDLLAYRGVYTPPWPWGSCCPANKSSPTTEAKAAEDGEDEKLEEVDEVLLEGWEPRDKRTLVLIDISGVYQLHQEKSNLIIQLRGLGFPLIAWNIRDFPNFGGLGMAS